MAVTRLPFPSGVYDSYKPLINLRVIASHAIGSLLVALITMHTHYHALNNLICTTKYTKLSWIGN